MARLTNVRLPPLAWVAIAAATTAVLRFAVALQVRNPIYYPDEYRATALARSVAEGGLPRIRGEFLYPNFTSYVPSFVQAPAWLIEDVDVAYRVAQGLGCLAFATAGVAAYFLARGLSIGENGSILVALLALSVPAGAYTATLLAESYAYPAFLFSCVLGVRALADPSPGRHAAALVCAVGVCFVGGLQFAFYGAAYVAAWLVLGPRTARAVRRRITLVAGGVAAFALALLSVAGGRFFDVVVNAARVFDYSPGGIGGWYLVNVFMLAIAAGWVLVPGAVLGFRALLASPGPTQRCFAVFSLLLVFFVLAEAALMSQRFGLHERFTFYVAPLLATAFAWWVQRGAPRRRLYAAVAYCSALAAVILPISDPLDRTSTMHSPTLIGLSQLDFGGGSSGLGWAPVLVALSLLTALYGASRSHVAVVAIVVCVATSALTSRGLLRLGDATPAPRFDAPAGTTLLTWPHVGGILLQKMLFWNPEVERVALFGPGRPPDDYAFVRGHVRPDGLFDRSGQGLPEPYVLGPATAAVTAAGRQPSAEFAVLHESPSLLAFGWYPNIGYVSARGLLVAAAAAADRRIVLRLRARTGDKTISIRCGSLPTRAVEVRTRSTTFTVPVPANTARMCSFVLVRGSTTTVRGREVAAEATLSFVR